jgi:DNA-entry nuclease
VSRDTVWLCTIRTGAKSIELSEKRIEALTGKNQRPEDKAAPDKDPQVQTYILNTHTHKFHNPDCANAAAIKEKNKAIREDSRENIISEGYSPCGSCKP